MKNSDKILAICAITISLSALIVSIYQTQVLSMEKDAAVWPYLRIGQSWSPKHYTLSVQNSGIGPGIIKNMSFNLEDTTFQRIDDLVSYSLNQLADSLKSKVSYSYSNIESDGTALIAGEKVDILNFKGDIYKIQPAVKDIGQVNIVIEYCSVYNKCWVNKNNNELIELEN